MYDIFVLLHNKRRRKENMIEDQMYNRVLVATPVLLAIFGVMKDGNYIHLGYLLLVGILVLIYLKE